MINTLLITGFPILIVAISMTMVGKGGGNFYVVILAMAGVSMHQAAATGQFILFAASVSAMMIFHKNKSISWQLAIIIGLLTAISALAGGYFSNLFTGFSLKVIFAFMLIVSGAVMLIPVSRNNEKSKEMKTGTLKIRTEKDTYYLNMWIVVPVSILTGFSSGMVGVSGGSFLVPLMVLAAGVPMHTAVGTASTMIAATALMGFTGHAIHGDFNPSLALPLAVITIVSGLIGGRFAMKAKPKHLKKLFAYTNWLAAVMMAVNAFIS